MRLQVPGPLGSGRETGDPGIDLCKYTGNNGVCSCLTKTVSVVKKTKVGQSKESILGT